MNSGMTDLVSPTREYTLQSEGPDTVHLSLVTQSKMKKYQSCHLHGPVCLSEAALTFTKRVISGFLEADLFSSKSSAME